MRSQKSYTYLSRGAFVSLRALVLCLMMVWSLVARADEPPDNFNIDDMTVDVKVEVKNGRAVRVREKTTYTASAVSTPGRIILAKYYDNEALIVDKASAPGAKPVYRASETGDVFYSGSRVCLLPLELKPGKPVKAIFETTYVKPEFFTEILVGEPYFIRHFRLKITVPADLSTAVMVKELNMPDNEAGAWELTNEGRVYTLEINNIPPYVKKYSMSPNLPVWWPTVAINVSFDSVDALYAHLHGLLDDESEVAPAVAQLTATVTKGLTDDRAKVDAIASWVRQNIRYVAIEHGEWSHRPDRAEAVLEKRYGDCKGSANLIRAMLRAAGIDGRLVWIGTRNSCALPWSESCSISSGNHQIAAAVLSDTTLFLDGTVRFAPTGFLPYGDADQEVIIENGDGYILTTVPSADTDKNVLTYKGRFDVDTPRLSGRASIEYAGCFHIMAQGFLDMITASKRETLLNAMVCGDRKGMTATNFDIVSASPNSWQTTVSADISDANGVKKVAGGSKLYVTARPLRFSKYSTLDGKNRPAPFDFGSPDTYKAEIDIVIPEGFEPEALPKRQDIQNSFFEGFVEYMPGDEGTVKCRAEVKTLRTEGTAAEIADWNAAVQAVDKASGTPLILLAK